eukprot:366555-Chlamydomonas_euryale.AAC.17
MQQASCMHVCVYEPVHACTSVRHVAATHLFLDDARRIKQNHLVISAARDADNAVACGLRLVRHNAQLLPHNGVDERRLARIGLANHRYVARLVAWRVSVQVVVRQRRRIHGIALIQNDAP